MSLHFATNEKLPKALIAAQRDQRLITDRVCTTILLRQR